MNINNTAKWIFLPLLILLFFACTGDETGSTAKGELSLLLTDAPTEDYKAVYVTIKEVRVHSGEDAEEEAGGWDVVAEPNETYNLLELVNGALEELGARDLNAGHYTQLRMVLDDSACEGTNINGEDHPFANYIVTRTEGYEELKIPSGFQSGIKIVHGFDIAENQLTELILDFDASNSIVKAGNSGKWILKPTINVIDTLVTATLSGTISDIDGNAVQHATVSALVYDPNAETEGQLAGQGHAVSEVDGYYFIYLWPGTYKLAVYKEGYAITCRTIVVEPSTFYDENFTLEAADTGTISGGVIIEDAVEDQTAELNFGTNATCGDTGDEPLDVLSESIANGGTYSVKLPAGTYTIVASTEGKTTKVYENIEVTSSNVTNQDVTL